MNSVDIVFALVLLFAIFRGYSKGLLGTAAAYVAPVAGFMLAADWSDPVRDMIRVKTEWPEIVLDMVAPVVVFLVVVIAVRLAATLFGRLLGVGLSMPSRILASVAGMMVSALILGCFVLVVRELKPIRQPATNSAGEALVSPLEKVVLDLDQRLTGSLLAPPLADLASAVVSEAISKGDNSPMLQRQEVEAAAQKAADAAATLGQLPLPTGSGSRR